MIVQTLTICLALRDSLSFTRMRVRTLPSERLKAGAQGAESQRQCEARNSSAKKEKEASYPAENGRHG